jgi:UDP-N-acetylglucosamine 2-epimerase (non-hydrolysing)
MKPSSMAPEVPEMAKVLLAVGARPNLMKMAPLYFEIVAAGRLDPVIVHTGQHYDYTMSQAFFEDLELPNPDHFLGVGSGTHAEQTAKVMIEFDRALLAEQPDWVVVFGDVNSTLACSLTARKRLVPVAHVEAGLRSFDETMPEEINRRLTDAVSDLLLTPSPDADENLEREGIDAGRICRVGNIMIDSLAAILGRIDSSQEKAILDRLALRSDDYVLVTLHRPSNVDDGNSLTAIIEHLNRLSRYLPIIFPMHPRTRKNIEQMGIAVAPGDGLRITEPMRYRDFIVLQKHAKFVLTDSGGIQEETTYLGRPCLTLRPNTERPITIGQGTNELISLSDIDAKSQAILSGRWKRGTIPELWDGKTAGRIVRALVDHQAKPTRRWT